MDHRQTHRRQWKKSLPRLVLGTAFLTIITAFLLIASILKGEDFLVTEIEVKSELLDREYVLDLADIPLPSNTYRIDLNAAKVRLENSPLIRSASVERHGSNRIEIHVQERTPVAWVTNPKLDAEGNSATHRFTVDAEGIATSIDQFRSIDPYLPVLIVAKDGPLISGQPLPDTAAGRSAALISRISNTPIDGAGSLMELRVSNSFSANGPNSLQE